jgi:tRNA 2-thiouridine synthesizing protein A
MDWDEEIDAAGLLCPLPVLKLQKRLRALPPGRVVRLAATDPASWVDVPHFCQTSGHDLLRAEDDGRIKTYLVRARRPGLAEPAAFSVCKYPRG